MCVRVRGQKGQDDGNKGKQGEAEIHLRTRKLLEPNATVNLPFLDL